MYSSPAITSNFSTHLTLNRNHIFNESDRSRLREFRSRLPRSRPTRFPSIRCQLRQLRERIETVKNAQKITESMKLVAAAKIRRAQQAVINGRPFTEALVHFLFALYEQLKWEDIDCPLTDVRPVKKVALVVVTGDRGLCGGFNNSVIRKAENRMAELRGLGINYIVISVGKKGNSYFKRRDDIISVDRFVEGGAFPTAKEAQIIADDVFSLFITEEVDKVELVYTKFVSLVRSDPVVHTLLPLAARGEFSASGDHVDPLENELFRLTTKEGKLSVKRDRVGETRREISALMEFEQDPVQILDAMMPLYLNSQILRALQESSASELAARMNAMTNATDNAVELKKNLSNAYNRERQAKITGEILEIVAGAEALR